jgi:hypothetical protein
MKKKITKQKNISPDTFPFSEKQLTKLREELDTAGGFDELMVVKEALSQKADAEYAVEYHNPEAYKEKFLTGEYESLKEFYDTEIPYSFWSTFYETLRRVESRNE